MKNNKRRNNNRQRYHHSKPKQNNQQMEQDFIVSGLIPMLESIEANEDTVTIPRNEYNLLVAGLAFLEVALEMCDGNSADYEIGKYIMALNKAIGEKEE